MIDTNYNAALLYYKLLRYYQNNPRVQREDHIGNSCNAIKEFIFQTKFTTASLPSSHHMFSTRFCLGCGLTTILIPEDFRIDRLHVYTCFHCNDSLPSRSYSGEYNPIATLGWDLPLGFQQDLDRVVRSLHTNTTKIL